MHSQDEIISAILRFNGITDKGEMEAILNPDPFVTSRDFCDPDSIGEDILFSDDIYVHGDYDADGLTAIAVVKQYLPDAKFHVPEREDGYGMSRDYIDSIPDGATVITVDCGISSRKLVEIGQQRNIKFIITDHHTPSPSLVPQNCTVINPKLSRNSYHGLSGAGLIYLIMRDVYGDNDAAAQYAAVGTVCDVMPVIGPNRWIVSHGIELMRSGPHAALDALIRKSGSSVRYITEDDLGWRIGPMINACGRLGAANTALEHFTGNLDESELKDTAALINKFNTERKLMSAEALEISIDNSYINNDIVLAYVDHKYHGIMGLIAGRLSQHFELPALVMMESDDVMVGSMRSPEYFDCHDFVVHTSGVLSSGGGHRQAAGLSFKTNKLSDFLGLLESYAPRIVVAEDRVPIVKKPLIPLPVEHIEQYIVAQDKLRPYGVGFDKPVYAVDGTINNLSFVGADKNHAKFDIDGIGAIYFNAVDKIPGFTGEVRIVCTIGMNYFAGKQKPQLEVREII